MLEAVDGRAAVGVASHLPGSPAPGRVQRSATVFAGRSAEPVTRQHGDGRWTTTVPAPDSGSTLAVARELAARGAQLVEICGGTPLATAALVREALDPAVAVSLVGFPYDSLEAVAAYLQAFAESD